jgi:hypothetical protein
LLLNKGSPKDWACSGESKPQRKKENTERWMAEVLYLLSLNFVTSPGKCGDNFRKLLAIDARSIPERKPDRPMQRPIRLWMQNG